MRILPITDLPRKAAIYVSSVILLGTLVALYSLLMVVLRWDPGWLFLAALTGFGAFFLVRVPFLLGDQLQPAPDQNLQSLGFSICDVFVFTAILLYSPEVAVVIGLIDGTIASSQILRRQRSYRFLFNLAQLSCVIFLVGHVLYQLERQTPPLDPGGIGALPFFLLNLAICALLYFLLNTLAVAVAISLSTGQPLRELWVDNFSFSSIANLAAATGAAGIFFSFEREFLLAAIITVPVLVIVYHSYRLTNQRICSLLESEKLLQSALDSLNSYIAVIDASGEIIATNAAWQAFESPHHPFGKAFGAGSNYLQKSQFNLSPPQGEPCSITAGIERVLAGGEPLVSEYRCSGDGRNSWFVVRVNLLRAEGPTRAVVSHEDITERKRAEADLRESEERYRKFFEEDLTGDFTAGPAGELVKCNPAFARILGFDSLEDASRANLFDLFPSRSSSRDFLSTLLQEKRLEYFQLQLKSIQGELLHLVANITVRLSPGGDIEEIQGYLFDDTTRKRLEEELRQAHKMEAVGKLAGGIAHDFNNILTVITGYGEFLLKATEKDEKLHREALIIMEAARRAAKLTAKLLAFSRRQMLQPEVLNLNLVVRETEALLQRVIGEDIQLMTRLDAGLGMIRVDPSQIEQVIMNLAVNARDAMPNGGQLSIETSNLEIEEGFSGEISPGRYSCLQVRDSGEGIAPELRERIFEPFFTTKEKGQGTGLGLSTVYGIVKQSGGHITVGSEVDVGTVFKLYFPQIAEYSGTTGSEGKYAKVPRGTETILLVEDEPRIRQLIRRVLSRQGYHVLEAENGAAAVSLADSAEATIHLLLTDLVMPEMGGWDLAKHLKQDARRCDIRVLYISGYPETKRNQQRPTVDPIDGFLAKPFTPDSLLIKVREVLDKKISQVV